MKIIRKPHVGKYVPYIGLLTDKGKITGFSDIEFEKNYLTAKRLWIVGERGFYESEMQPLQFYVILDEPIQKGDLFISFDFINPQTAVDVGSSSIKYYLTGKDGKPIKEYEGKIQVSPLEGSFKYDGTLLIVNDDTVIEKMKLMGINDIMEI
jgi:hypothetical protein